MKIGIIGTGNMGRILIEAFVEGKAVSPSSMIITNRTISKAMAIRKQFPGIQVTEEITEVGNVADLIFICVKPHDILQVLLQLKPVLTEENVWSLSQARSIQNKLRHMYRVR